MSRARENGKQIEERNGQVKREVKPKAETSRYGFRVGEMAVHLEDLLYHGTTEANVITALTKDFEIDERHEFYYWVGNYKSLCAFRRWGKISTAEQTNWNDGISKPLKYWNNGMLGLSILVSTHYSIVPLFHYSFF